MTREGDISRGLGSIFADFKTSCGWQNRAAHCQCCTRTVTSSLLLVLCSLCSSDDSFGRHRAALARSMLLLCRCAFLHDNEQFALASVDQFLQKVVALALAVKRLQQQAQDSHERN